MILFILILYLEHASSSHMKSVCHLTYSSVPLISCPYSFTRINTSCNLHSEQAIFSINFKKLTKIPNFRNIDLFSTLLKKNLHQSDPNSLPIPTVDRGLYFEKSTKIISERKLTPAPDLSLDLILKVYEEGDILTFGSESKVLKILIKDSKIVFLLKCSCLDLTSQYEVSFNLEKWVFVEIRLRLEEKFSFLEIMGQKFSLGRSYLTGDFEDFWEIGGFRGFFGYLSVINKVIGRNEVVFKSNDCDPYEFYEPITKVCVKSEERCKSFSLPQCSFNLLGCSQSSGFLDSDCILCKNLKNYPHCGCGSRCLECFNQISTQCEKCLPEYLKLNNLCILPFYNWRFPSESQEFLFDFSRNLEINGFLRKSEKKVFIVDQKWSRGVFFDGSWNLISSEYSLAHRNLFVLWFFPLNTGCLLCSPHLTIYANGFFELVTSNDFSSLSHHNQKLFFHLEWTLLQLRLDYDQGRTEVRTSFNGKEFEVLSFEFALIDLKGLTGIAGQDFERFEGFEGFFYKMMHFWNQDPRVYFYHEEIKRESKFLDIKGKVSRSLLGFSKCYQDPLSNQTDLCGCWNSTNETLLVIDECCTTICPTGFELNSNNSCILISEEIANFLFTSFNTSTFPDSKSRLSFFVSTPGQVYPTISPFRGIYFYKNTLANISELILSYNYSISLWINIKTSGTILSFKNISLVSSSSSLKMSTDETVIYLDFNLFTWVQVILSRIKNTWNQTEYSLKNNENFISFNSSSELCEFSEIVLNLGDIFSNLSGFSGFIYRLSINLFASNSEDYYFLETCAVNQYYFNSSCFQCKSNCLTCAYRDTCNVCSSLACESCFNTTTCKDCIENALLENGTCRCFSPFSLIQNVTGEAVCSMLRTQNNCLSSNISFDFSLNLDIPSSFYTNGSLSMKTNDLTKCIKSPFRGVYFKDGCLLTSSKILIDQPFLISLWLKIEKEGGILAIQDFLILIKNASISDKAELLPYTTGKSYPWQVLTIENRMESTNFVSVILKDVNGIKNEFLFLRDCLQIEGFLMLGSFHWAFQGFNGFIWKIKGQEYIFNSSQDIIFCDSLIIENCIWNVSLNEYFFNGTAFKCNLACTTCRRESSCGICNNDACSVCSSSYSVCDSCISNAYFNDSACFCNDRFVLVSKFNAASTCKELGYCTSDPGQKKIDSCCYSVCPSQFVDYNGNCTQASDMFVHISGNELIETYFKDQFNNDIWIYSPPYTIKQRGYYFPHNYYIHLVNEIVASHSCMFHFWIKILNPLTTLLDLSYLSISLSKSATSVSINDVKTDFNVMHYDWSILIFKRYTIGNQGYFSIQYYPHSLVYKAEEPTFCNFERGIINIYGNSMFLRRFQAFNRIFDLESNPIKICSATLMNDDCIIDCSENNYFNESCSTCLGNCSRGCVNGYNCNLCFNPLCIDCSTFTDCLKCDSNSTMINGSCKCQGKFYLDQQNNGKIQCLGCNPFCNNCAGPLPCDCNETNSTGKFNVIHCCSKYCPTGFEINGSTCSRKNNLAANFSFDTKNLVYFDSSNQIIIQNAVQAQGRGVFFRVDSYGKSSNFIFHYELSLIFLIKVEKDGNIIGFGRFLLLSNNTLLFLNDNKSSDLSASFNYDEWFYLSIQKDMSFTLSTIFLTVNNFQSKKSSEVFCDIFEDFLNLGSNSSSFQGFLYTFQLFTILQDLFLSTCSNQSNCNLPSCTITETLINSTCYPCLSECESCISTVTCSLCSNSLCESCQNYYFCDVCTKNSSFNESLKSCECDELFFEEKVNKTHSRCEKCSRFCGGSCFGPLPCDCNGESGVNVEDCCSSSCPDGFFNDRGKCFRERFKVVDVVFKNFTWNSDIFKNEFWMNSTPAYQRGHYFDKGSNARNFKDVVLNYQATLDIWIKVTGDGKIFRLDQVDLGYYSGNFVVSYDNHTVIHQNSINIWTCLKIKFIIQNNFLVISVSNLITQYWSNQATTKTCNFLKGSILLGETQDSFTGFLWKLTLLNSPENLFSTLDSYFLSDCEINYFHDGSSCKPCPIPCKSCRSSQNCNQCSSLSCTFCENHETCENCDNSSIKQNSKCICASGFTSKSLETQGFCDLCEKNCNICSSSDFCLECKAGWEVFKGKCVCRNGQFLNGSGICQNCSEKCLTCAGQEFWECLSCDEKVLIDGICLEMCPLSFKNVSFRCEIIRNEVVYYDFLKILGVYYDEVYGVPMGTGVSNGFKGDQGGNYPIPVKNRGIYFFEKSFVSFPYEYSDFLLLSDNFVIEMWLFPENQGVFLSESLGFLKLELKESVLMSIMINNKISIFQSFISIKYNHWNHLMIIVKFFKFTSLSTLINLEKSDFFTVEEPFVQKINSFLVFPTNELEKNRFTGFLFTLKISVFFSDFMLPIKCNECGVCLNDGSCLSPCLWNQTLECENCLEGCVNGCVFNDSCILCADQNCLKCTDFETFECLECNFPFIIVEGKCVRNTFSATLSVLMNNSLLLKFSEELLTPVENCSVEVFFNQKEIEYSLKKINDQEFLISPKLKKNFVEKSRIQVKIKEKCESKNLNIFDQNELSASLFPPENIEDLPLSNHQSLVIYSSALTLTSTTASSLFSGNPSSFFTFLSVIEMYNYIPLLETNISMQLIDMLSTLNIDSMIPNVFDKITDLYPDEQVEKRFELFGMKNHFFLVNSGIYIMTLAFGAALYLIAFVVSFIPVQFIKDKASSFLSSFRYSYLLRMVIQSYLDILIFSLITLTYSKPSDIFKYFDLIISGISLLIIIFSSLLIIFIQLFRSERLQNEVVYNKKFYSITEGFIKNNGPSIYYLLYFFRRLVFALSLIFITDRFLQVIIIFTASCLIPFYLFYSNVFESQSLRWFVIFNDILFCVFLGFISIDFIDNKPLMSANVKNYCINIILVSSFSGVVLSFFDIGYKVIQKIRNLCKKNNRVLPVEMRHKEIGNNKGAFPTND